MWRKAGQRGFRPAGAGSTLMRPREIPADDNEPPGVPGFRSWGAVYWFVFGAFVVLVIALAIFSQIYG